jgi:hypothetical protein
VEQLSLLRKRKYQELETISNTEESFKSFTKSTCKENYSYILQNTDPMKSWVQKYVFKENNRAREKTALMITLKANLIKKMMTHC